MIIESFIHCFYFCYIFFASPFVFSILFRFSEDCVFLLGLMPCMFVMQRKHSTYFYWHLNVFYNSKILAIIPSLGLNQTTQFLQYYWYKYTYIYTHNNHIHSLYLHNLRQLFSHSFRQEWLEWNVCSLTNVGFLFTEKKVNRKMWKYFQGRNVTLMLLKEINCFVVLFEIALEFYFSSKRNNNTRIKLRLLHILFSFM